MDGSKETGSSRHSRTDAHVDSEGPRPRQHKQDLARLKPEGISALRGTVDTGSHPEGRNYP